MCVFACVMCECEGVCVCVCVCVCVSINVPILSRRTNVPRWLNRLNTPSNSHLFQHTSANSDFEFAEEFEYLELGDGFSREAAQLDVNRIKNRCVCCICFWYTQADFPCR